MYVCKQSVPHWPEYKQSFIQTRNGILCRKFKLNLLLQEMATECLPEQNGLSNFEVQKYILLSTANITVNTCSLSVSRTKTKDFAHRYKSKSN